MALTSYSWTVMEEADGDLKLVVHNSFNEALDYLHKSDNFCYSLTQTDSLRQIYKELNSYLKEIEEGLENSDAILLG